MILGILQARMASTRLPGKSLADIAGRPMLARQLERLDRSRRIDELLVATSEEPQDDAIARLCGEIGVQCFRGNHRDVLDRFYRAGFTRSPEHLVRLTGDCPLTDPELVDTVVERHLEARADYTSNALVRTFPDGLDVEAIRWDALCVAWREAELPSQREHVTAFIYQDPDRFRLLSHEGDRDLSKHRWAVDHQQDLELVRAIYAGLYANNPDFSWTDALVYVEAHPGLQSLNAGIDVDEGWRRSLQGDLDKSRRPEA